MENPNFRALVIEPMLASTYVVGEQSKASSTFFLQSFPSLLSFFFFLLFHSILHLFVVILDYFDYRTHTNKYSDQCGFSVISQEKLFYIFYLPKTLLLHFEEEFLAVNKPEVYEHNIKLNLYWRIWSWMVFLVFQNI